MSVSDEMSFGYRRKTKIKKQDRQLPMIDFNKRVINFGDDLELFKIVSQLIMSRVDLDGVDHGPLGTGNRAIGGTGPVIDLDELPADDDPGSADEPIGEDSTAPLSRRWGIEWHRDRYGLRSRSTDDA